MKENALAREQPHGATIFMNACSFVEIFVQNGDTEEIDDGINKGMKRVTHCLLAPNEKTL